VAVEKLGFLEIRLKMDDWKCIRSPRRSPMGLPSASVFRRNSRERVFQQPHPFTPDINQNADKYEREIWEFLQSGKYRGSPCNFANAMAGLPNVSWRTSWNICSANPCRRPILPPAIRDHIRRKFPNRLRELLKARTEEDVKRILRKSHSMDETWTFFKKNPSKVLESLEAGKPQ